MGAHEKENKSQVVSEYEHQWWSGRKPRDLGIVKILNKSTVQDCLDHYRERRSSLVETANVGDDAGVQVDAGSRSSAGAGDNYACPRCTQYREVLSDVLQDVITFRNLSSVMATSSETQWKLGLRWASTFYLLHEAALLKETAGCSALAPATTAQHIANVARTASSELTRLQSLPASSYKWTWGKTLTQAEILALRRTGTRPGAQPHSGYDLSLVEGKMPGDYTEDLPSSPTSHGRNEVVATEAGVAPPITDLGIPPYLLQHDRVSYNPLGCSTPSLMSPSHLIPITPQDPLPVDLSNTSLVMLDVDPEPPAPAPALGLADVWTDTDPEEPLDTRALGLADVWSDVQSSDAEASTPAPAHALLLADNWSDNDEPGGHEIFQPLTPIALLLADDWDENEVSGNDMTSPALAPAPDILLENMCCGSDHSSIRDNETESSEYTYGSQLIVSPSRITLDPSSSVPLDTDAYCPLSDNLTPADTPVSTPLCTYGPEHFAYLQDHLFEDSSDEEGD
ncbi:hypothetical protein BYT27DRAFT_7259369 [Phlegmacium glaucopus]|nr:hypothetical protein BYT27DRAFT_7259369 [Phlegmacium glaucopus]